MTLPDAVALSPALDTRRVSVAIVLATLVTLAAAVPLGILAWQARDDAASAEGILATADGEEQPLAGLELARGSSVLVVIELPDLVAVSWAIHHAGDGAGDGAGDSAADEVTRDESGEVEAIGQGQLTREGQPDEPGDAPPRLELAEPSALITALDPGRYDLLITATTAAGSTTQRAARFEIGDAE